MRGRLSHLRRGAVAPMAALMMTALLGFTGLAVDVGRLHLERRALQAAVDAAALSSARAPAQAQALAGAAMGRQGYASATRTVVAGVYTDDPGLASTARFTAGGANLNAVRVTAQTQLPLALSRVLTGQATTQVTATATAAHRPLAAFSVGSQTLGLDGGLLNQLLSGLLGGSVSLDVVSYRGLAAAQVGLLEFTDALATRVGLAAGTYADLLNASVGLGTLLDVAADVLASTSPSSSLAVEVLSQAANAGRSLNIGNLLGLGIQHATKVGQYAADQSYTNLDLNVGNLVQSAIQLGGSHAITLPLGVDLPGLAHVGVQLQVIEPPQGTPMNALAPVGTTVSTAQVRLLLSAQLVTLVSGGVVNLPLIVDVAPAQAQLRDISCQGEPGLDATATLRATAGAARVQISAITPAQFASSGTDLDALGPATILNAVLPLTLPLLGDFSIGLRLNARAVATVGIGQADLQFTMADVNAGSVRSINSSALVGSLLESLRPPALKLEPELVLPDVLKPLAVLVNATLSPLVGGILSTVLGLLTPVLSALDPLVDQILSALGVQLGVADVRVTGIRCGVVALVN